MNSILLTALASLVAVSAWAGKFTKEQLDARFYYDLGPAERDVSAYPAEQKNNYAVFVKACSQCHTVARPLNAPISKRADWERYVRRMHLRTKTSPKAKISKSDAAAIVDFLAFDSKIHKLDHPKDFEARTETLKALFNEAKAEKERIQREEGKAKARPAPPYTGDKP